MLPDDDDRKHNLQQSTCYDRHAGTYIIAAVYQPQLWPLGEKRYIHLPHRLVAMLLLELQEVRLLSGDLLRQDVLQRRQGSLAAGEAPEGALVPGTDVIERDG